MRHADVRLCFVGSFAFYLGYRFFYTREFDLENFPLENWLDNKKWFFMKLLVDGTRTDSDFTKPMNPASYSNPVKVVLGHLGIPSNHWLHLGRQIGPKLLEFLEELNEDIRMLGNWDPKIQETNYSTKLPWRPMRKIAGHVKADGMFYLPRGIRRPSDALMKKTPFGVFVMHHLPYVEQNVSEGGTIGTALMFLRLMKEMGQVFLQDAAAIWLLHPERRDHPMFTLPVFCDPEWEVSLKVTTTIAQC